MSKPTRPARASRSGRSVSAPSIRAAPSSCRLPPAPARPTCSPAAFCACWPKSTSPARSSPSPSPTPPPPRCATASSSELEKAAASEPSRNPSRRVLHGQPSPVARSSTPRRLAGISSTCPRSCASPPSTPSAAILPCSSRCSPDSAAASTSTSSPTELYRRAARRTLEQIDGPTRRSRARPSKLCSCGATTAGRRWKTCSSKCSSKRDRWMHDFVLEREPDWDALRERLERPFAQRRPRCARPNSSQLLDQVPGAREEALELARFACEQSGGLLHRELAELAEFPCRPIHRSRGP